MLDERRKELQVYVEDSLAEFLHIQGKLISDKYKNVGEQVATVSFDEENNATINVSRELVIEIQLERITHDLTILKYLLTSKAA